MKNLKKLFPKLRCLFLFKAVILTAIFLLLTAHVFAQKITLSISPPLIELFIKPGKSVLIAYNIRNLGDPAILSIKLQSFEPKDNLGNIKLNDNSGEVHPQGPVRFDLDNSNIALGTSFFLKTRQTQQILLRIRIPEGTPEGDYYYTLLAETKAIPHRDGTSASRAKATIGSNILITVTKTGKVDVKGKIALFNTLKKNLKIFDSNEKIPVVLIIENKGKNLIKPQGEIVLRGSFGEQAKYEIIPRNILSESQRLIQASPSASINCQNSKKQVCLFPTSLILSGFFIGRYTLSTTVTFGNGTPNLYATTSFIALPYKLILAIIFSLSIGVLIIRKVNS